MYVIQMADGVGDLKTVTRTELLDLKKLQDSETEATEDTQEDEANDVQVPYLAVKFCLNQMITHLIFHLILKVTLAKFGKREKRHHKRWVHQSRNHWRMVLKK